MTTVQSASAVPFLDRDLSWLEFNKRVLHETLDDRTPLLERLKFLAIFSSNLDEWFMKRAERLREAQAGGAVASVDGAPGSNRLARVREALLPMLAEQARMFTDVLHPMLERQGIHLLDWSGLDELQRQAAAGYFRKQVFPILTPLKVDPSHPFPFISNLSTSLGILQRAPEASEPRFARVKIPQNVPSWLGLPASEPAPGLCFVRLVDVIAHHLDELFPGMEVLEVVPFRVTRNGEVELEEDEPVDSFTDLVEEELRQRRLEDPVRLEYAAGASRAMLTLLSSKLRLNEADLRDGRPSAFCLASAQASQALVEVGVEPALDGAWGDGEVVCDVLVGPATLGQADDQEAVIDLGIGFLSKGVVEPLGLFRRQADTNHWLSVPLLG